MSFEEADIMDKKFNFKNIFYQRIKMNCKLSLTFLIILSGNIFASFVFVKTSIFVGHGNILSSFDVLKQKWLKHIQFEADIISVFRSKDENGVFDVCVLLANS